MITTSPLWHAEVFGPEVGSRLAERLNELTAEGWTIAHVLVNGVDRWTIICHRPARARRRRNI